MLIILSLCSIGYAVYQSNNDGIEMFKSDVYVVTPSIFAITFVSTFAISLIKWLCYHFNYLFVYF